MRIDTWIVRTDVGTGDADRPTRLLETPTNGTIPVLEAASGDILDAEIRERGRTT